MKYLLFLLLFFSYLHANTVSIELIRYIGYNGTSWTSLFSNTSILEYNTTTNESVVNITCRSYRQPSLTTENITLYQTIESTQKAANLTFTFNSDAYYHLNCTACILNNTVCNNSQTTTYHMLGTGVKGINEEEDKTKKQNTIAVYLLGILGVGLLASNKIDSLIQTKEGENDKN